MFDTVMFGGLDLQRTCVAHWHADFGKTHAVLDFKHW